MSKSPETECRVYIIAADLTDDNEAEFRNLSCAGMQVEVLRCSAESLKQLHTYNMDAVCVATPAALLKFKLAELIPDLDKVIYADGDVIFCKDLSDLYEVELGTNLVAAVADSGKMYSKRPILTAVKTYFNSGIMLLNLKLMREDGLAEKLITAKKNSTDASLMDQNIFNQVFDGRVIPLPIKYNCLFVNLIRAYESHSFTFRQLNGMFGTNYHDFVDLAEDAAVIHFSSKDKPWKVDNVPLVELWDEAYSNSAFKETALSRGQTEVGTEFDFRKRAIRPCNELIVSMTTYAARIAVVHQSIETILNQTMKPDRVILWLSKEDFPDGDAGLPENLTALFSRGLEVRWVEKNLRSHKKYFYVLQEFPSAAVITVDDDLQYPLNLVERLYKSYERFPNCISAVRTHLMTFSAEGKLNPYRTWPQTCVDYVNFPSLRLFATTGAGVLYPPGILPKETFDDRAFMAICPDADDVWVKMMSVAAGIRIVNPCYDKCALKVVEGSQESALWQNNVLKNANDLQLEAVEKFCRESMPQAGSVISRIYSDAWGGAVQEADVPPPWLARDERTPRVSVIIVMSNTSIYLERCLSSWECQTYKDFEIICVDDGSTDCPGDILRRHYRKEDRISVYWQSRHGLASAHRLGLSKARGEFVVFCRAEDLVAVGFLEKLVGRIDVMPADVVFCGHLIYNNAHRAIERVCVVPAIVLNHAQPFAAADIGPRFYDQVDPELGTMLIRRQLLARIPDAFPESFDCDIAAAMSILLEAGAITVVNESLYFRCHQILRDRISRRDAFPDSLINMFSGVFSRLERSGSLEALLPGYARFAIDRIVERLLGFVDPGPFNVMYAALRGGGLADIGLDLVSPADIGWSRFRILRAIKDSADPVPFVKEVMLQKQDLEHSLRVAASVANWNNRSAKSELEKSRQLIAAKDVRIDDLESRINKCTRELVSANQVANLKTGENAELCERLQVSERECSALKKSLAYTVGMFVTWPVRKLGWVMRKLGLRCLLVICAVWGCV